MLTGIIFVREAIISLDLQRLISKHYKVVNVFKNIEQAPEHISGINFIIIDSDSYSDQELSSILRKLTPDPNVNIIKITSFPADLKSKTIEAELHLGLPVKRIVKPFTGNQILGVIDGGFPLFQKSLGKIETVQNSYLSNDLAG